MNTLLLIKIHGKNIFNQNLIYLIFQKIIFYFRLSPTISEYILRDATAVYEDDALEIMDKFARARLWENNAEGITQIANMIDADWRDVMSRDQMLQTMDMFLPSSKTSAINDLFICCKCMTTLTTEHDVFRHCKDKHPDDVLPNTSGEQAEHNLLNDGFRNMKNSATGSQLLIMYSGHNEEIRYNMMNAEVMTVAVSSSPNPEENDFVYYPVSDVNLNIPYYNEENLPLFNN